jgi:enoyl-CoA hydratase
MGVKMRKYVNYEFATDGVAIVTINNAPVNALTKETTEDLLDVFNELRNLANSQKTGLVVILTGVGEKIFVAGADVNLFLKLKTREDGENLVSFYHKVFDFISEYEWPVICAINGAAIGGGLELALACDIRIASEDAVLSLREVALGFIPGGGGTQRLPRLVGPGRAKEIIFSGSNVNAKKAFEIGLVERIAPRTKLIEEAINLGRQIIANAPKAIKLAKVSIDKGLDLTLKEGLKVEINCVGLLAETEDVKEGAKAFFEKRKPIFKGL